MTSTSPSDVAPFTSTGVALGPTMGFPRSTSAPAVTARQAAPVSPRAEPVRTSRAPTPKRPKGRWFISLVIMSICGTVLGGLWNEFLRYEAYGHIEGRVIKVATPWDGVVRTLHVREGDYVQQDQLLVTMENVELQLRLGKLQDEIRVARAGLDTRLAELQALKRDQDERALRVHVDYFQLLGRYYQEQSRLEELRSSYQRFDRLSEGGAVAKSQIDAARYAWEGQQARVAELETAVSKMKAGLKEAGLSGEDKHLLDVEQAQIEALIAEWERLSQYEQMGQIKAPVNGRIVRQHHFTGEYVTPGEAIFELLEEGSLNAVVYLRQGSARRLPVGAHFELAMPPRRGPIEVQVDRIADDMVPAPPNLRRYYRANERLVAIYAKPRPGQLRDTRGDYSMWLGAEVRLPRWSLAGRSLRDAPPQNEGPFEK